MVRQYLVSSWLLLALQVKVGKVALFVGKIFAIQCSTTKTTNILPHENHPLYIYTVHNVGYRALQNLTIIQPNVAFLLDFD